MTDKVITIVLTLDAGGFRIDRGAKLLIKHGLLSILGADLIRVKFIDRRHFAVTYWTPEPTEGEDLRLSLSDFVTAHIPALALFSTQYGEIFL